MLLLALLLSTMPSLPDPLQTAAQAPAAQEKPDAAAATDQVFHDGEPLLSLGELQVGSYEPQHIEAKQLGETVSQWIGRSYYVGEPGQENLPIKRVFDLDVLGQRLIIYDTPEYVARVLDLCRSLDQPPPQTAAAVDSQVTTVEVRPRFLSVDDAAQVLAPLNRTVSRDGQGKASVTPVPERGLLVLQDTPAALDEMRALLERVDVPSEQVVVTCWLVAGQPQPGEEAGGLPAGLADHLNELLPGMQPARIGFALLRSKVGPGSHLEIEVPTLRNVTYRLEMIPTAFDAKTGSLTVERCELEASGPGVNAHSVFRTSAVFRGGETTVLGATGTDPVFVVVQVAKVP